MERAPRRESEGRSRLVIEGSVRATAVCIGDGMTAASQPCVTACVRPSPSLQQASAVAELPPSSDLAQHASRVCADASQPTHTFANVGMNPISSASAVTMAVRRVRMKLLWTFRVGQSIRQSNEGRAECFVRRLRAASVTRLDECC